MLPETTLESPQGDISQQLQSITHLVSLPEVYLQLQRTMEDPLSDIDDFAAVISADPNLTIAVLKVVNSAFYGFPAQIDSISRAINFLGIGQLHDLALGICAIASLKLPNSVVSLKYFWRQSLICASLVKVIARAARYKQHDQIFVAGLLHDIGHLVLYSLQPQVAEQILEEHRCGGEPLHLIETRVLGLHYGQIGASLMEQWGLSEYLQQLTRFQPTPEAVTEQCQGLDLLHLSRILTEQIISDGNLDETLQALDMARYPGLDIQELRVCLEQALQQSQEIEKVMLSSLE